MKKNIIIFGTGHIAEEVYNYIKYDTQHDVLAFTINKKFMKKKAFLGKKIYPFENIEKKFSPKNHQMFIAIGYTDLNKLRFKKYLEAKKKGYKLFSYISSKASLIGKQNIGENCLILENNSIQTTAVIGSNVFLWCGNLIGHHVKISDNCYIAGNCTISGSTKISSFCFVGVNTTISHGITIGKSCFLGANSFITKNIGKNYLTISANSKKLKIKNINILKNLTN